MEVFDLGPEDSYQDHPMVNHVKATPQKVNAVTLSHAQLTVLSTNGVSGQNVQLIVVAATVLEQGLPMLSNLEVSHAKGQHLKQNLVRNRSVLYHV
jgi:pyridoxine/pyridoxamine 5'-phosphate oxidase